MAGERHGLAGERHGLEAWLSWGEAWLSWEEVWLRALRDASVGIADGYTVLGMHLYVLDDYWRALSIS